MPDEAVGIRATASSGLGPGDASFQRLLDRLPAAAYLCDPEGLITYFNAHAVRVWGREPRLHDPVDRFCGSFRLYSAIDGSPIPHDQCWMARALRERREFNGEEIVIERPGGERATALAHANPIFDAAGDLLGAVNVLVDITDQKRAEMALMEADHAKSEFLATVSHEIRTPLNAIMGYLALLDMETTGPLTVGQRAHLGRIQNASRHLLDLIDEMLDFSRLEAGRISVQREVQSARESVDAAMAITRPLAQARGIRLTKRVPAADAAYLGDENRVRQLLINLVVNAIKFSGQGRSVEIGCTVAGRPDIGLADEATGDRWICFNVRDQGIGIPSDQLQRIFEPFVQVEPSRTRTHGGAGLGLTISRRLARLMGGDLTVESTVGAGSVFTLWMPAADASPPDAARRGRRVAPGDRVRSFAIAGRTLLAGLDDILAGYVERLRVESYPAEDASEFAARLANQPAPLLADLAAGFTRVDEDDRAVRMAASPSEVRRVCALEHGRHRAALGWTDSQLVREFEALEAELAQRVVDLGVGTDTAAVLAAIRSALERAEAHALEGLEG